MHKLKVGDKAPDFELQDQNHRIHKLSQYKGEWILLYFYPKDDTPGCTKEACSIRDNFPNFNALKTAVLGVSVDSPKSHKNFHEKYALPFTLLADEDKKVVNLYDVWKKKKFMGKEYTGTVRSSFLIDPKGKIFKIYENVKPENHAQEVLKDIKNKSATLRK